MKSEQIQACPFCQNQAHFAFTDNDNRKFFSCSHCGNFEISVGAEKRVAESIPQWRAQLSELARRGNEEKVLVVTLPSSTQKREGVANPALETVFVPRTKLRQ